MLETVLVQESRQILDRKPRFANVRASRGVSQNVRSRQSSTSLESRVFSADFVGNQFGDCRNSTRPGVNHAKRIVVSLGQPAVKQLDVRMEIAVHKRKSIAIDGAIVIRMALPIEPAIKVWTVKRIAVFIDGIFSLVNPIAFVQVIFVVGVYVDWNRTTAAFSATVHVVSLGRHDKIPNSKTKDSPQHLRFVSLWPSSLPCGSGKRQFVIPI